MLGAVQDGVAELNATLRDQGRTGYASPFKNDMSLTTSAAIGGCLARHLAAWEEIGAEQWVLSVLRRGYRIPLSAIPPLSPRTLSFTSYLRDTNRDMALSEEIAALLRKEAVEEAPLSPGYYSRVFVVPKASGGFRPVIDLSHLNQYVKQSKFRMETPRSVLAVISHNDWMVTIDLKDAYLQIPVHPASQRYLRFAWERRALQFRALCFGLSTAPQMFTRMMAPVASELHKLGIRTHQYLDDWLLLAGSYQEAPESTQTALNLCTRLGIRINYSNSSLLPMQEITYLGVRIQSTRLKAIPTQKRVDNLLYLLRAFLDAQHPPAKEWQQLLGHMSSLTDLVPGAQLRTRNLVDAPPFKVVQSNARSDSQDRVDNRASPRSALVDEGIEFNGRNGASTSITGPSAVYRCLHPGVGVLSPR